MSRASDGRPKRSPRPPVSSGALRNSACGPRPPVPDVSSVLDFSKGWPPDLVRDGAGDPTVFGVEEEEF